MGKFKGIVVGSLLVAGGLCQGAFGAKATIITMPSITKWTITVSGFPPGEVPATGAGISLATLNSTIAASFQTAVDTLNNTLGKFQNQKKLAEGFGNANAYSAQSATLQGYQNYGLFAVTAGGMLGVQAPSIDPAYFAKIGGEITTNPDIFAGIGASFPTVNVGVNLKFLVPGLYANAKFGTFHLDFGDSTSKLILDNMCIGLGANYALVKEMPLGPLHWRGVSVGSGILYQKNSVGLTLKVAPVIQKVPLQANSALSTDTVSIVLSPLLKLGIASNTVTVPVDVTTSVCLLWFLNLNAGIGFDFNFGGTDIIVNGSSTVNMTQEPSSNAGSVMEFGSGNFEIDGSTKGVAPSVADFRLMTGLGLNIAMVKLDIPIIYYVTTGLSIGATVGVVF